MSAKMKANSVARPIQFNIGGFTIRKPAFRGNAVESVVDEAFVGVAVTGAIVGMVRVTESPCREKICIAA